jgi:glycosyltransferase involved in cell wall biosynthesis
MAWKLPIVASQWRGNVDVLTEEAGAICFEVTSSLVDDIGKGLEQAFANRPHWLEWGNKNRAVFESRYRDSTTENWLVDPILDLLQSAS